MPLRQDRGRRPLRRTPGANEKQGFDIKRFFVAPGTQRREVGEEAVDDGNGNTTSCNDGTSAMDTAKGMFEVGACRHNLSVKDRCI